VSAIAIVGMACRFPDADSPEQLWLNVLAQRRAFRRIPPERLRAADYLAADRAAPDRTYSAQAAVLDGWVFDRVRFRISGGTFRSADLAHWLALDVAAGALAAAGYPDAEGLDRERTLVVVGNTLTGEFSRAGLLRLRWPYVRRVVAAGLAREGMPEGERARVLAELEQDFKAPFEPVGEETLAGGLSNTIAGRICNTFDLKGGGYTVDGACAASLLAVATAATALEQGDADVAVAGGVDLSLDPFELVGFAKAGALAADEMRVYDAHPQGFWPGEGCGFLVLRRLEDALADGVRPEVAIRGWGVSSDGAGGITRPELEGQLLALRRAYARAGFGIDTVQLFEGHGTGTSVGDATELATLARARAEAGAADRAAVSSVKANIGHTKAAAGVAGLIKAALSLREELVPPATGCVEPHAELRREDATLRIACAAEPWPVDAPARAGVSAMGFGGVNAHLVLERVAPRRRRGLTRAERRLSQSSQDAELFLFGGDYDGVGAAIEAVRGEAGALSIAELGDLAAALHVRLPQGVPEVRAAAVASSARELERALEALAAAHARGDSSSVDAAAGVAFGAGAPAVVGFLFTGQGAPATADGGALARRFPFVRALYARAGIDARADLVETAAAQPAIVVASLAGLELLRRLGVEGAVAVGHSLGELTALHWAGAIDASGVVELAAKRGRAMSDLGERNGAMASLACSADVAARLADGTGAVVAGINGPQRTVVSGSNTQVDAVGRRAAEEGIAATPLSVSHAFHSPLVAAAAAPLADALAGTELAPLRRRVVSTVTGGLLAADADLRELLVRQVTAPVLFAPALAVAASTAELLVEVGPGRVLEVLARDVTRIPAVSLDVGGRSLRAPLVAAGALYALGALPRPRTLFAGRFVRPFTLGARRSFLANPCEAAPAVELEDPVPAPAAAPPAREEPAAATGDALAVVRDLVASRAELPPEAILGESRLLGDLHLSSIAVAEIAAAAARRLDLTPPAAPGELATATVRGLAEMLERLAATAPDSEPAVPAGVASWTRAYERVLVERARQRAPTMPTRWQVVGSPGHPLTGAAREAFAGDGDEDGVVLVLAGGHDEEELRLLVDAAREVRERQPRRFAVVEHGGVAGAFARVLHLEHGVETCVVGIEHAADLRRAREEAESARGYREVHFVRGSRRVPVLRPLALDPGPWPLDPGDVLLVTGGGKGIGAECALALARARGLALALVGRSDPAGDSELAANLRRIDATGIRHLYVRADVVEAESVRAAVALIEQELGPISGVLHAAGVNAPALLPDVDEGTFAATLAPKVTGLRNVLDAVDLGALRLVVGFGSIIARTGLRGEAHYALANDRLRSVVDDLSRRAAACRCLTIEWSVWAGVGMGERLGTIDALARAGVAAIPVDDGVRLLTELVCARDTPTSVIGTGRFGPPPTVELERRDLPLLRFLERPLLEYPGVELVVEAELCAATDPYLTDHAFDGVPLLPAVIGLEAIAQAAAPLLGTERPCTLEQVELARPVTVPPDGTRRIRLAALRQRDGAVDVVLRSDETGFQVDHFRATCRRASPLAGTAAAPPPPARIPLDPEDVYDALLFHGPRFRRLIGYRALAARSCTAEVESRPAEPWFGAYLPQRLLLGDPGARDAFVHALQACIPQARVLPVGVERIVTDRLPEGVLVVWAQERDADGDTFLWDVEICDENGVVCERWEGLRLRRVAAAVQPERWPAPLLVPYLERRLADIVGASVGIALVPREGPRRRIPSDTAIAAAARRPVRLERRADGRPEVADLGVSAAHVDGMTLAVAADGTVTCDVEAAVARGEAVWRDLLGADRLALAGRIAGELHEELDTAAARVWAAAECVRKAGLSNREPLALATDSPDGWTLLRAGRSSVATYATCLDGVDPPVTFAFLIGDSR
jgi:enediyne polyketide synthase